MAKYVVKRIAYMLVVLLILSFIMFMIYNLVPSNRAYTDAFNEVKALSKVLSPDEVDAKFEELYLQYQRKYGTDNPNKVVQYARWMGFYPLYDGSFNGILQGNFGYSYDYQKDVIEVVPTPMAIQFEWKSPFLTLGNPNSRKIIDDFYLLISDTVDNNFDFRAYKDYDTLDAQDHEQISVSNSQNLVWAHENSQGNWVCWADDDSVSGSYALAQRWAIPCETAQKIDVSLSSLAVQFCISGSRLDQNFALLALECKEITVD